MSANELSALLWRERELLEALEYKLEVQQILLSAGRSKWIARASAEVEHVTGALRKLNLLRDVAVQSLADEWGISDSVVLRQIIEQAPEEVWVDIFNGHLIALVNLTDRIRTLRESNEQMLRTAVKATQETLAAANTSAGIYDARGNAGSIPVSPQLVDKDI